MSDVDILALIEDVESKYFRTHQDTGAHSNTLFIWNRVRKAAGLEELTHSHLVARAVEMDERELVKAFMRGDMEAAERYKAAILRHRLGN